MSTTLTYYNQNAQSYTSATQALDFRSIQDHFLSRMPQSARILDFGCGSGRDTRYFLNRGFQVDAVDGSSEMCRIAGEYTGIPVRRAADLAEAVSVAASLAVPGTDVLLSPAATSFDAYSDYRARGDHFAALVKRLCAETGTPT